MDKLYTQMSTRAAATVIAEYSTSFSLATKLLNRQTRGDIRNLYSMVRIADEIVDGAGAAAGLSTKQIAQELDRFEQDTFRAMETGFSTNPSLQAFALTAQRCNIDPEHVRAFFRSMRADITESTYSADALSDYIYGSAEVIGLMCLSVFFGGAQPPQQAVDGARHLGAAFQKINFLRDLAEDSQELGRTYFAEATGELSGDVALTNSVRDSLVADIRKDLAIAKASMPLLPRSARVGVWCSYLLFEELTNTIAHTDAAELLQRRVSVPKWRKAQLAAQAFALTAQTPRQQTASTQE